MLPRSARANRRRVLFIPKNSGPLPIPPRKERAAGASFFPPKPEPTGFNYKRPAKPPAPPPPGALARADKHREARLQGQRERSPLTHPFPPSLSEPGSSNWSLRPGRPWEGLLSGAPSSRGRMETGSAPVRGEGAGRGTRGAAEPPSKHQILAHGPVPSETKFL